MLDAICRQVSTNTGCRWWPLAVFFNSLDVACIGAWTICRQFTRSNVPCREFTQQLSTEAMYSCSAKTSALPSPSTGVGLLHGWHLPACKSYLDSPAHSLVSSSLSSSPLSSSITPSLFHSRLKTYLFDKSFPPWQQDRTGPITLIVLFLVSHFNLLFIPCGRLSWLPVSFLQHVKYTLSYRIVLSQRVHCH